MTELLISDGSLRIMLATLEQEGLNPAPAIHAAGIDPDFHSLQRHVTRRQETAFQRAFVAQTGRRPDLWFRMGMDYSLAAFGSFAPLMMAAPDLHTMLSNPHLSIVGFHDMRLKPVEPGDGMVGIEVDVSTVPPDLKEFTTLVSLGCTLRILPELFGGDFPFSFLCLPMSDPGGSLQAQTETPICLDTGKALAIWPAEQNERPLQSANPVLYKSLTNALDQLVSDLKAPRDLEEWVFDSIFRHLGERSVLEQVAKDLGLTARTLQRRLAESGLQFRSMLDKVRNEAAIEMLVLDDAPLVEVAWNLGYNDLSSFTHAFRRWTGTTPGTFRQQVRDGRYRDTRPTPSARI